MTGSPLQTGFGNSSLYGSELNIAIISKSGDCKRK
jgi:hypothetical protein